MGVCDATSTPLVSAAKTDPANANAVKIIKKAVGLVPIFSSVVDSRLRACAMRLWKVQSPSLHDAFAAPVFQMSFTHSKGRDYLLA